MDRYVPVLFRSWGSASSISLPPSLSQPLHLCLGGCVGAQMVLPGFPFRSLSDPSRSVFPHSPPGLISTLTFPRLPVSSSQLGSPPTVPQTAPRRRSQAANNTVLSQWLFPPRHPAVFFTAVTSVCECFTLPQLLNLFGSSIWERACRSDLMVSSLCDCG